MDYDIVIIGAGIAGSTLASLLAPHARIAVVDRNVRGLPGSTGHAPGVVAQINSVPVLTELARRSVAHYRSIPGGFDTVGGLEVTMSNGTGGLAWLHQRSAIAYQRGIQHRMLSVVEAQKLSPMVRNDAEGAIFFPNDGTANARTIAHHNQDKALEQGARLIDGTVISISKSQTGHTVVLASGQFITTRRVVIATGIWAGQLAPTLTASAVAFAHPYAFSRRREPRKTMPPFVRFPCQLVYSRDHGERDGLGSYAHDPINLRLQVTSTLPSAYANWEPAFDHSVRNGLALLPDELAAEFEERNGGTVRAEPHTAATLATKDIPYAFTGLFTITPDGLPLVGPLSTDGLYAAVGCWVTQAAGSMGVLADQILADMGIGNTVDKDRWLRVALDPRRFSGIEGEVLEDEAREKYRDIWNKKQQDASLARRQVTIIEGVLAKM